MSDTKIKICGITRVEDALHALACGADAIGMVFYGPSPRAVTIDNAREIGRAAGPFVTTVALFVNPLETLVREVLATVKPHVLQFHGDESAAFCEQFGRPYLKAIRVQEDTDIAAATRDFSSAAGILFDAWSPALYGGTGKTFDWNRVKGFTAAPLVLAGGLNPDNVEEAVRKIHPYGVDVSGGVELAPGIKDPAKILSFVRAVKRAESQTLAN